MIGLLSVASARVATTGSSLPSGTYLHRLLGGLTRPEPERRGAAPARKDLVQGTWTQALVCGDRSCSRLLRPRGNATPPELPPIGFATLERVVEFSPERLHTGVHKRPHLARDGTSYPRLFRALQEAAEACVCPVATLPLAFPMMPPA